MSLAKRLVGFMRKPAAEKRAALKETLLRTRANERRRLRKLLSGPFAPPRVLLAQTRTYVAYRPESDIYSRWHPELAELSEKWIKNNVMNNAGDLPRFYALILNIKQVLAEGVAGDMAELGVYRGNSAALLAHYARIFGKQVFLFDTFEGFDNRDLVGIDNAKSMEFDDTSLGQVRELVGIENITFVQGRFPESIPPNLHESRYCLVHIDCDLYAPAKAALEFFYPRLSPGGLLIMHDYGNPSWDGIKRSLDEFCRGVPERPVVFGDKSGTAMIRKLAA